MRFVDLMLNFPRFFLLLTLIALLRPSIWVIMAVIGLTGWMGLARLVRGEILSLREREFVQGARALGAADARIMFRHILPNALVPVLVSATLGVAGAILAESGLSFLGLGVQPPTPSWGNILIDGKANIEIAWWLSVFPGLAILVDGAGLQPPGRGAARRPGSASGNRPGQCKTDNRQCKTGRCRWPVDRFSIVDFQKFRRPEAQAKSRGCLSARTTARGGRPLRRRRGRGTRRFRAGS